MLSAHQILALLNLPSIGPKTVFKVAERLTAPIGNNELPAALAAVKPAVDESAVLQSLVTVRGQLTEYERQGVFLVSYWDEDYPDGARHAVDDDGNPEPALLLYGRGNRALLTEPGVAVIGTRNAAEPALAAARLFAEKLVEEGITVVSGLAFGCDAAAHWGAVSAEGPTIAVVGNGLDTVYPPQHLDLADTIIAKGGLFVSEYPLGTVATPATLIARDRLQTALSQAVIVVQTPEGGGSMHAAKSAYHTGKDLYVVRYKDEAFDRSPENAGNQWLIENCGAKPLGPFPTMRELDEAVAEIADKVFAATL